MRSRSQRRRGLLHGLMLALATAPALAQVHYHPDGAPWNQRADHGPDAEVDGWYYNLGITGLRVRLDEKRPKALLVKHVFASSPSAAKVRVGDWIVGVSGARFETAHQNGYGMDVFGAKGPMLDFARALEASQSKEHRGRLAVTLERDGAEKKVELDVGTQYGAFAERFPEDCPKSERILDELCAYLVEHQGDDGSWGSPVQDMFAPLALLASDAKKYAKAIEKSARMHARTTKAEDEDSLINWRYMAAGIVLSEYFLATRDAWILPELKEIHAFLLSSQYVDLAQVNPKVKESHPGSWPKNAQEAHGGWGHIQGFEGYGPICMITGQGALAFALMQHCGVEVDRARHDAAYAFLARGTGKNGYVWYEDEVAGHDDWADLGRTGAAGIANAMSPWKDGEYAERARAHAKLIALHPESYPDTHGSPLMGMGYAALGAQAVPGALRTLFDANRWWFTLAQCRDGSFYYQPNRDNAGYGADSRIEASAVVAFVLSIPRKSLFMTGRQPRK